jgi:HD domain
MRPAKVPDERFWIDHLSASAWNDAAGWAAIGRTWRMTNEGLRQLVTRLASRGVSIEGARLDRHDLERLTIPDSAAARAAEELATTAQPRSLVNHGVRSYAFGALLGLSESRPFESEILYVAALLHDIGLMEAYDLGNDFEADGEAAARELLLSVGWDAARADRAAHAIRDHWDGPESDDDVESLLLAYGTSVDVGGWRLEHFDRETVDDVVATAPRDGFKRQFIELVERQAVAKPWCHLGPLTASPAFAERVLATPFDS